MSLKVYEIMQRLSVDQLSNLAMSEDGSGTIRETDHLKIINAINTAMKRLYSRFVIQAKHLRVILNPLQTVYPLTIENSFSYHAENPGLPNPPFIVDNETGLYTKFEGDILQIVSVKDGRGKVVTFNDPLKRIAVQFPQVDKLIIPATANTGNWFNGEVRITYKPKYVPLSLSEDVLESDVILPDVLHEAMMYLVASMVYSGMNGQENVAISQGYLNTFESLCNEVSLTDVINESESSIGDKFSTNGFV